MASAMHQQHLNEVDKLLQKMVLENKQQTRPIQAERQKSLAYQEQLNDAMEHIRELEMSTSKLSARDKQLQLDFKAHKDKLESFKETVPVLEEHEEALKQKLQQALMVTQKQITEQHSALQKYRDIWATYQAKYESSNKCKELLTAREKLNLLQERDNDLQTQIQSLKDTIELFKKMEAESKVKLSVWVTEIATHRSNTASTYTQLKAAWTAIAEMQAQIEAKEQQIKALAEVTPSDALESDNTPASNVDQPTTLQLPQLTVDQYHQAPSVVYHETDSQTMDTLPVRGCSLPQASVSTPVQHQETHKKPATVTIPKLIHTPKRHLPAVDQGMHKLREEGQATVEKGLQRRKPSSVSVSESGPKTTSRFTFQIPQFNRPTASSSPSHNQATATTSSHTIPSTLPPKQSVRRSNPLTITTPTQPTNTSLHISTPTRPQQRNIITSANTIRSPRPPNVLPPQAGIINRTELTSTQCPQQLPDQSAAQDSNDDAVMESEEQVYHSQQHQEPVEAQSAIPEQQPQQQFPPQEDNNSFFSGIFGNQSVDPSQEQGSMWDTGTTMPSEPQNQPQNDLFSFSSANTSSAIDFGNLFGSAEGNNSNAGSTSFFNFDPAPSTEGNPGSSSFFNFDPAPTTEGNSGTASFFDFPPASTTEGNNSATSFFNFDPASTTEGSTSNAGSGSFFNFDPAPTTSTSTTGSNFSLFGPSVNGNSGPNTEFQLSFDLPSNSSSATTNTGFSLF